MIRALSLSLAAAASLAAAGPATADDRVVTGEVTGVSVMPSPGHAEIVINVKGAVDVQDFVLKDPARLVVDVLGARLSGTSTQYDGVNRGGILNVRYAQFRPDVVRIVIELSDVKDYSLDKAADAIRVSFGSERPFLAWSSTTPATLTPPAPARRPEVVLPLERTASAVQGVPRVTVTWDQADLGDVIAGFAAISGRTIVLGRDITGKVTAEIKNQPWPLAFAAVLATQGLSAQEMPGGIIRVDSPKALQVLDSLEPLETRLVKINYANAGSMSKSIEGILTKGRGHVVADTASNSLILTDTRSRIGNVEDFVKGLDIRTRQVSIQAKLILVDRTDIQALGIQYDFSETSSADRSRGTFFNTVVPRRDFISDSTGKKLFDPGVVPAIVNLGGQSLAAVGNASAVLPGSALDLIFTTALGGYTLASFLKATQSVNLSDVQAEPLITTLDNRKADILVGEETPVRVVDAGSAGAATATVQFKQTGIRLTVTPHVTNNRQILLDLHTERSAVQILAELDLGFNFTRQTADNQILVNDGETAVIGGLTLTEITRAKSGIPLLVDLPLIGKLFGFDSNTERRRDLIILVTPRIIDDTPETQ